MASNDDFLASLKGIAQNLSQMVSAMGAPGRAVSAQTSPLGTLVTTLGTASLNVVSYNVNRRGISFHNCDPTNNSTIFLVPLAVATIGQGMVIVPGQSVFIGSDLSANASWAAIAGTGSANSLLVMEFV